MEEKEYNISVDTPDILEPYNVGVYIRKEYTPDWPVGVSVKYVQSNEDNNGRLRFSIPEKKKNGFYWMSISNNKTRVKALIRVPVSIVPQTEDPLKYVFSQKWFKALKFTLHSHNKHVESVVELPNIEKELKIMLTELLVQQEVLELDNITTKIKNIIYGLHGLKTVIHYPDFGLVFKGVYTVPVNMGKYRKINFNLHIEYAVFFPEFIIEYKELNGYYDVIHIIENPSESINTYSDIPNYRLELVKSKVLLKYFEY